MLQSIWFVLWGVLWAIYFMLDGFDLGLGALLPVLARNEIDKRLIYNAAGPFWDGNEVWLIAAGGITFAAFPTTYAVMFSGLYSALMLILFALILRGVSFEFRGRVANPAWKRVWDWGATVGSFLPALLFGVAFANIFQGIPIDANGHFHGTLLTLLNPYGLLGGVLFLSLFMLHGCLWLTVKTQGVLQDRAEAYAKKIWILVLLTAVAFLLATGYTTSLYDNYLKNPFLYALPLVLIPLSTVAALLMTRRFLALGKHWQAWFASCVTIVGTTLFGVAGLYPNLLPSSLSPAYSLTIYNSSSSPSTLKIMLTVTLILVPVIIAYQTWAYRLFKDKLSEDDLPYDEVY